MSHRNPLAKFALKGRTDRITHLADVISDSYCITSEKRGHVKYRKRFAKAKKTVGEVVEAILLLEKHKMLDFGYSPEDCMDPIRKYLIRSSSYGTHSELLDYFKIIEEVGELLDTGDSRTKWFSPQGRAFKAFASFQLHSQYRLLCHMLKSGVRGETTVELTILGMFSALNLTDKPTSEFRDQFVKEGLNITQSLAEELLVAYLEAKEASRIF